MPARIVLVHDDTDFLVRAAAAIRAAGYDIVAFEGSMAALEALGGAAKNVELLITRVNFSLGSPHGVSLAMMAHRKIPNLKVLFLARPEQQEHATGIGEFMPVPVTIPELVDRVSAMLAEPAPVPKHPASQRSMTESR
jgi:DNA-binding NtrC family response regulator